MTAPAPAVVRIAVIHGPNLNLLGSREPEIYGRATLAEIDGRLEALAAELDARLQIAQFNSCGKLLDHLAEACPRADGIVINPAGLGHTSVALLDGLLALGKPYVETHLSNPYARESFRRRSLLAPSAVGIVAGFGADSYLSALRCIVSHLRS